MFKKIYVEITNNCNLSCPFCVKTKRKKEYITVDNFKILLNKLKGYTNYLYFHVMGEPLLHPAINELINMASKSFKINITTNGRFLEKIIANKNIRQMNISLHSLTNINDLDKIFHYTDLFLQNNTIINYRLWVRSKQDKQIIEKLNNHYNVDILKIKNNTIKKNLFFDIEDAFIWPDLKNKEFYDGGCKGTIDHIGILVDGTVIPCCLDSEGIINLGNIYTTDLETILNSEQYQELKNNFLHNKKVHPLCQKCNFYNSRKQ